MKKSMAFIVVGIMLVIGIGSFFGGLFFANKTEKIPNDTTFEFDAYFSDIRVRNYLSFIDGEFPFVYGTGASTEEEEDTINHPDKYKQYVVRLVVKNNSNHDVYPVWVVSPGYFVDYEGVKYKNSRPDPDRRIWINHPLTEGLESIKKGETLKRDILIVVKTEGMDDSEIQHLLQNLQINLQMGLNDKTDTYSITSTWLFYPVFYRE